MNYKKLLNDISINDVRYATYQVLDRYYKQEGCEHPMDYDKLSLEVIQYIIPTIGKSRMDWKVERLPNQLINFDKSDHNYIYLASPFFNFEERLTVCRLEYEFDKLGFIVYSPSRDGKVLNKEVDSIDLRRDVFNDNIKGLEFANLVVGVIDDRDPGTLFEIGSKYAIDYSKYGLKQGRIMTYSSHNYGVNLMLLNSTLGHFTDISDLLLHVLAYIRNQSSFELDEERAMNYEVE